MNKDDVKVAKTLHGVLNHVLPKVTKCNKDHAYNALKDYYRLIDIHQASLLVSIVTVLLKGTRAEVCMHRAFVVTYCIFLFSSLKKFSPGIK